MPANLASSRFQPGENGCGKPVCPGCRALVGLLSMSSGLVPVVVRQDSDGDGDARQWRALQDNLDATVTAVLQLPDAHEAAIFALRGLRARLDYSFDLLGVPRLNAKPGSPPANVSDAPAATRKDS
jgi:hypothetical protein